MFIYVASPYSHKNPAIEEERFKTAQKFIAEMQSANSKDLYYSPIVYFHPLKVKFNLPGTFESHREVDLDTIRICDKLLILTMPGWADSVGVTEEIEFARSLNKPIEYR